MTEPLLGRLAFLLERDKIPYLVIGGQAVLFYGFARLTQDINITLGIDVESFPRLHAVVRKARLKVLVKKPQSFIKETRVLPTQDPKTGLRIDFIFSNTPYEREAIRRARRRRVGRATVRVARLEDLLIHKLVAGRPIDLEDARVLVARHRRKIDFRYLRRWLREFEKLGTLSHGLLAMLNQIRREVSREP